MSQLTSTLSQAADKNHKLLSELAATDYAPSSLKQNTSYISDLKKQIERSNLELARLHLITEDERKDHLKYRDSNVKRWAHKLQGQKGKDKFSSKQEKEEREFLDAWQKERAADEGRDELVKALQRAEQDRVQLDADNRRQNLCQKELDELYSSIFSGPTPEVFGEDELEQAVEQAKAQLEHAQGVSSNEKLAQEALGNAEKSLNAANINIEQAVYASRADLVGGGFFADMMERDALARAQNDVNATVRHLTNAQHFQPSIRALAGINIDQGHFFSDVMFDSVWTDLAQHDRIQNTQKELAAALQQLRTQVEEQKQRAEGAKGNARDAGDGLERVRRELQRIRAEAFERLAGAGAQGAPPAYQAAPVGF